MHSMTSTETGTQVMDAAQTNIPPTSTSSKEEIDPNSVCQFNIGLSFCASAADLSEADSWVVSTNADVVAYMVQWEADIMDFNNAALQKQVDKMAKYDSGSDTDSANLSIESTTYTQMSQEAQGQTNTMSSEQTTLNNFGENAMSDMQSFNSMAATILQGLDYLKNLL